MVLVQDFLEDSERARVYAVHEGCVVNPYRELYIGGDISQRRLGCCSFGDAWAYFSCQCHCMALGCSSCFGSFPCLHAIPALIACSFAPGTLFSVQLPFVQATTPGAWKFCLVWSPAQNASLSQLLHSGGHVQAGAAGRCSA